MQKDEHMESIGFKIITFFRRESKMAVLKMAAADPVTEEELITSMMAVMSRSRDLERLTEVLRKKL